MPIQSQMGQLFDTFYDILLSKSPDVPPKFAHTDFERQQQMLKESRLQMLLLRQGIAAAEDEIERLGRRHGQLDIRPDLYGLWLDSLCEAVARHDPEYRPELEAMWRRAMQDGIARMVALYDASP